MCFKWGWWRYMDETIYNHKLNIALPQGENNVRNLKIEDKNGHSHVLCHSTEK